MEGRRRRWARPQAGAPPWTAPRARSHWDCWGRLRPSGASRETSLWKSEDVCPEIVAHLAARFGAHEAADRQPTLARTETADVAMDGREEESGDLFAPVISGLPVATGTAQ